MTQIYLPAGQYPPDTNQDNNPNLIPGISQSFVFSASVPQSALGDDNSYDIDSYIG